MSSIKAIRRAACALFVAQGMSVWAVAAQQAPVTTADSVQASLEEVIVMASLRREPLVRQPASVTVIDAATVRAAGIQHLQDLLPLVPNLNWASGTSRPRYFQLRGIGETDQWQGAPNPSVGFLIDGIDFSGIGMPATLFDVGQVEVLRGPQGTTYGANALAGLINVATRPATRVPEARVELTAGNYETRSAGMVIGGPIGQTSSGRLVVQRHRSNGFSQNVFLGRDDTNGFDETTVRGRLAASPLPDLDLDLSALWVDLDNGFDAFSLDNSRRTRSDQPGRDSQRSQGLSLSAVWRAAEAFDLRSVSAWADSDIDYAFDGDWGADPRYDFTSRFLRRHRILSQDLRLVSRVSAERVGDVGWVGGLYALDVTEGNDQLDLFDSTVFRALQSDYAATSLAAYGQLQWRPATPWRVGAGLRAEQRRARYRDSDGVAFQPLDRMWGGHLAAEFDISSGRTAYLTVSRGYKAGGFNIGALVPDDRRLFGPEYLRSIELGLRLQGADPGASLEIALFHMLRSDQQVSTSAQLDPGDPLSFIYITDNAARGENSGAELTAKWRPFNALRVGGTLAFLRSRYLDYQIGTRDLDGRDQAHAPRWQYSMSLEYLSARGYFGRADFSGVGAFYFSESHDQRAPSTRLLNLRVGYRHVRWEASAWVRNAFDGASTQRGFFFGNEPPDFPDKLYVQPGDPRQAGFTFSFQVQ